MIVPKHCNLLPSCHFPPPPIGLCLEHYILLAHQQLLFILSLQIFIGTNHISIKLLNLPSSRRSSCSSLCSLPDQLPLQSWQKPYSHNAIVGVEKKKKEFSDEDADWLYCPYSKLSASHQRNCTCGHTLTWSKVTSVIFLSWGLVFNIGLLLGHSSKLTLVTCPLLAGLQTLLRAGEEHCFLPEDIANMSFTNLPMYYFLHLIPHWHSAFWTFVSLTTYSCVHGQWVQMTVSEAHIIADPGLQCSPCAPVDLTNQFSMDDWRNRTKIAIYCW